MPSVIRTVSDLRAAVAAWRRDGATLGFVPTMGALHAGHASLIETSLAECDRTVVSIFVNPMQFDRRGDLDRYPRTLEADLELLRRLGADVLFHPAGDEVYPQGFATRVEQSGLPDVLCGASRPGHFTGVLTVVLKLFNMVSPDRAYFGQKDYQQAAVIRRMARDLDLAVDVRVLPIVRDGDGLALSSRNVRLDGEQRAAAPGLWAALCDVGDAFARGSTDVDVLTRRLTGSLARIPGFRTDYAEIRDPVALTLRTGEARAGDLVAIAGFFGDVRLIDNLILAAA